MTIKKPPLPITKQLVLITGGARGLGVCLSQTFLQQGTKVIINYLSSADADKQICSSLHHRIAL